MREVHASTKTCIKCGKQATHFWPVVDPDVTADPYCDECGELSRIKLHLELEKLMRKYE